jgi:hypothetical protein
MALGILAIHAFLGTYSRYLADDFCTAGDVARLGFWGAQANLYQTWSGRFSFSFVVALTHLAGPGLTPYLPAFALAFWLGAFIFMLHQVVVLRVGGDRWILPVMLASVSIAAILSASPNIYQSLYWQTGMLTYLLPLALFTAYLGFLAKMARVDITGPGWIAANVAGILWPFFMGGFSETFVSIQSTALLLGSIILFTLKPTAAVKRLRWLVILGFLGSLVALILVASAPGNAIRQSILPERPGLSQLVAATLRDWYVFTARTVKWHFLNIALLSVSAALAGFWSGVQEQVEAARARRLLPELGWFLGIPFFTFVLMCASIAPYEYAISSFPDARVLITTVYIMFVGILGWGFLLGSWVARMKIPSRLWVQSIALTIAVVSVSLFFVYTRQAVLTAVAEQEVMRSYAAAWDERDRNLHVAAEDGLTVVYAASLTHMGGGLAELGYNPDEWINRCIANTYGFDQVIAK